MNCTCYLVVPLESRPFYSFAFFFLFLLLFKNRLTGNCRPVDKSMWNLFMWRGAERHPFITVCTVAYTLLSLCANSLVYLGYPRHKTICEHTGISCLFARLHKKPTSRGDRTHSSPKHTARASSLERYWKEFCRSKQTLTGNLLLQLLLCNVGEHPPRKYLSGRQRYGPCNSSCCPLLCHSSQQKT